MTYPRVIQTGRAASFDLLESFRFYKTRKQSAFRSRDFNPEWFMLILKNYVAEF